MDATTTFYDQLAEHYHLLFDDWSGAIERQGEALAACLSNHGVEPGQRVLDAAAGIGTQTLGLAARGYAMQASDISAGAIARLLREAEARRLPIAATVGDMRTLAHIADGSVRAVIACDNSVPHLLDDAQILQAFRACLRVLEPQGMLVISVRDYAAIERHPMDVRPYGMRRVGDSRFVAVQAWEWDGDCYDLRMYLTEEAASGVCRTRVLTSRYYAITVERLMALMDEAGFEAIRRHDEVLYQPVLIGRRP